MSDHEYTPSSKVGKWFNDRLPLLTLANHLTDSYFGTSMFKGAGPFLILPDVS